MKVLLDRKRAMATIALILLASSGLVQLSAFAVGNQGATNLQEAFGVPVVIGSSQNNPPSPGAGLMYSQAPGESGQQPGGFIGLETSAGLPAGVTNLMPGEDGVDVFWAVPVPVTTSVQAPDLVEYYYTAQTPGLGPYYPSTSPTITSAIPGLWLDAFDKKMRRTRAQIYVEILELVRGRGPMTPFEIAFYGRLNNKRTKECIDFLKVCNYLQPEKEDGKVAYSLTSEGAAFLERAKALFTGQRQFIRASEL